MKYFRILVILAALITVGVFGYYRNSVVSEYDKQAPVITADTDEILVSIHDGDEELLKGMTAEDDRNGDVTSSMIVESMGKFFGNGKRKITYAAFDEAGNVASYTRTLQYSDYEPIRYAINAPLRLEADDYKSTVLDSIRAYDCLDGDISNHIKYTMGNDTYYMSGSGEYEISYQVANSAGDTASIAVIYEVLEREDFRAAYPVLSKYLVYTKVGEEVDFKSFVTGIEFGNSVYAFGDHKEEEEPDYTKDNIKVSSDVDFETPGTYRVVYTFQVKDPVTEEKITFGSVSLYCVVEE